MEVGSLATVQRCHNPLYESFCLPSGMGFPVPWREEEAGVMLQDTWTILPVPASCLQCQSRPVYISGVCVCVCVFLPLPSFLFWMMRSPGQLFLMKPFIHRLRFFVVVCCITMGRPQPCGNIHSGCKEDDTPLEGQPLAAFERL